MGRSKSVPKDKFGKSVTKKKVDLVSYGAWIPNIITFKTIQLKLTFWNATNQEVNQSHYDKVVYLTKYRMKQMIRLWSKQQVGFREESIIEFDMSAVTNGNKTTIKDKQHIRIEVVLFTKPDLIYDKRYVNLITENMSQRIIDVLKEFPDDWVFVHGITKRKRGTNVFGE